MGRKESLEFRGCDLPYFKKVAEKRKKNKEKMKKEDEKKEKMKKEEEKKEKMKNEDEKKEKMGTGTATKISASIDDGDAGRADTPTTGAGLLETVDATDMELKEMEDEKKREEFSKN